MTSAEGRLEMRGRGEEPPCPAYRSARGSLDKADCANTLEAQRISTDDIRPMHRLSTRSIGVYEIRTGKRASRY